MLQDQQHYTHTLATFTNKGKETGKLLNSNMANGNVKVKKCHCLSMLKTAK